jgi:Flp pilus assembly protein TadB
MTTGNTEQGGAIAEREREAREAAEKAAASYAWDYFQFHAAQRQSVFRFFLTLVGVLTLAYGYSLRGQVPTGETDQDKLRFLIGILLIVTSFLFWRLDRRSQNLIKASEEALKRSEARLSIALGGDETVRLIYIDGNKASGGLKSCVQTFRQIYGLIFILVSLSGFWLVARYFFPH